MHGNSNIKLNILTYRKPMHISPRQEVTTEGVAIWTTCGLEQTKQTLHLWLLISEAVRHNTYCLRSVKHTNVFYYGTFIKFKIKWQSCIRLRVIMDVCIIPVYLTTLSGAMFIQRPVTTLLTDSEFKMVCKQPSWPNFRPSILELTYRDSKNHYKHAK
jgi:hypothetical protein